MDKIVKYRFSVDRKTIKTIECTYFFSIKFSKKFHNSMNF
ncbi:hypothetical protein LEP1GSC074_3163 [Leptospira noguchii str. Hook]|nr:hypothetical protein LEP1GSC074_3163 [Leptospira noguchii str. Hook]EMS89678.1 hypothetical protein LEP1GSC073_3439 [Leptospira noguchii str. Cascata]